MTFLPSFLLAIISTVDLTNKKSLSILISHPYLVLLPTFTMFSYSKLKIFGDRRIALSNKLTLVNMLVNSLVEQGIFFIFIGFYVDPFLFPAIWLTLQYRSRSSTAGTGLDLSLLWFSKETLVDTPAHREDLVLSLLWVS